MPDPILDLILRRKAAKQRKSVRTAVSQAPSPFFVPAVADQDINDQFEIDQIDTQIKGMGFDPDVIEQKIGDLPSYVPNHIVSDILNIENPVDLKRKKAAIGWQGAVYNKINNIADPTEKQKGIESFNFLIKGYGGDENANYESTINGIRAAKDAINKSLEGEERAQALRNLQLDAGYGVAKMLLKDADSQNRWLSQGLNQFQGIALDLKEIFDANGAEIKKQVTGKYQDPSAQAEQRIKLAELENYGISILGDEIEYLLGKKADGVKKANQYYYDNEGKLQTLKKQIEEDKGITDEQKSKLTAFQREYDDILIGKQENGMLSPYVFEQLRENIEKGTATPLQIKEYNKRVERLNAVADKYKQELAVYNETATAQSGAAREYNNIVGNINKDLKLVQDYKNLDLWVDYMAKKKNSQGERYPEYNQIQMEELVQDVAGANVGAGTRFVYNLANAVGGEAINGIKKVINNLTLGGEDLREAEMADAYRSRIDEVALTYETKDQALKERAVVPVVGKTTQAKLDAINASDATDEEKYTQRYRAIEEGFKNKDVTYAANPRFGKLNITSASVVNTASAVTTQVIGQIAQAYMTGGMGNVSKARQLATLFGTTFAQTFGRTYDQAVKEGNAKPFEYAVSMSTVEALSELPFNNLAMVEKFIPSAKKFVGELTEGQWKAMVARKLPSNLGTQVVKSLEGIAIEGALEEGLAGVGTNIVDKYVFGKDKQIFEDVDTQVLAGVIGFAPMTALGLPLRYRAANMGDKMMMYHAGYKADKVIAALNQQLVDGTISQQEASERIEAAKEMKGVIDKMPMYDTNGKPLSDFQKAQYAWNEYVKVKAGKSENLPAQQQEELKQLQAEADQSSSNILNGTENAITQSTQQERSTAGDLVQPAGTIQGQQEAGQGTGTERQGEIPQANVGYSDISGQEIEINETPQGLTEIAKKVVDDAFQAAKSLVSAGIKVRVFQNQADFERESAKLGQQARGQGVFMSDGKSILINLSKINSVNDWGIVWHEGAHPVMNIIRNTNPELYNKMAKGFGGLAKQGGVFAQIEGWANADYGDKTDLSTDEAMTETVSLLGDGKIRLEDIPTSFRQQVIDFVNQIAEFLGLGQLADTSERVFVQKAAQIANALRSGEDIASVVGAENVTRTENPFVGQEKKDKVRDNTPKPRDFKAAEEEVKALIEQQKNQPEAVLIEPQRDKDGKLKISVDFDEDGKRVVEVKYKQAPYELKKGSANFVDKDEAKATEILSDKIASDYKANEARPEIAAGIGWYSKMRQRFQKFFGANIETFGQLLAATSARTGVFDNFKQSVEAFKLFSQGKYNDLMQEYDAFVKDIMGKSDDQLFQEWTAENPTKRPREFDAREYRVKRINRFEKVPLKANGKKYNANSKKVLQALYGNWLRQTEGPKTKNFAGNLTGRSFGPTIDVWAARYLRRLIYQGKVDRWRIPPSLEKGVDYSILVSGEMSGDYPFAEKVMQMAADKIGINADDLQAFLWYLEKDVWDKNGWTNKAGAEKASFEQGADTLDTERYQAGVTTYKTADTFDPVKFEQERVALQDTIGKLPGVIAARVTESIGEFYSEKDGIYVEPTFDVEWTMERGADVTPVREKVQEVLKVYNQDATLFSKFVDQTHPNARPIIEIGLAVPAEKSQIVDDIKAILAADNVRGFTIAKDARGKILGVRSQFVPEFEEGVSIEDGIARFVNAVKNISEKYGKDRDISYIASGFVDTEVKFQDNGKESQQDGGTSSSVGGVPQAPESAPGGQVPDGQPVGDNQGGPGAVGGMVEEPGAGQQRRSSPLTSVIKGFYSPIEDRINTFKQPNASAQKWKEIVGAKSDEAIYSGLADWLNSQEPSKQLSKEDVLQFMRNNRIQVKVITRGGDYQVFSEDTGNTVAYFETLQEAESFMLGAREDGKTYSISEPPQYLNPRYAEYQLPGGQDYKEILITLPWNKDMFVSSHFNEANIIAHVRMNMRTDTDGKKVLFLEEIQSDWGQAGKRSGFKRSLTNDEIKKIDSLRKEQQKVLNGLKIYKLVERLLGDVLDQSMGFHKTNPIHGFVDVVEGIISGRIDNPYYDKREKKRNTDIIIQEVRNAGMYWSRTSDNKIDLTDDEIVSLIDAYNEDSAAGRVKKPYASDSNRKVLTALNAVDLYEAEIRSIKVQADSGIYTPAPYVTNTNAWVKLGLKYVLKEAINQGADRIAWTTGDQQNDRYDLSKQVDEIQYNDNGDGTYNYSVLRGNEEVLSKEDVDLKTVEADLGKEIADRFSKAEGSAVPTADVYGVKSLSGNNLKVGGKGMNAFYGDVNNPGIVANVAKALIKELTGKEGELVGSQIETANYRSTTFVDRNSDGTYSVTIESKDGDFTEIFGDSPGEGFKTPDDAIAFANGIRDEYGVNRPRPVQPAINVTPDLASSVREGMPQFKNSSVAIVNDAIQNRKSAAKISSKALESLKDQIVKLGYGYLPDDVRERLKKKQRLIDADINEMNVLNKRFENAVLEGYGVKYKNLSEEKKKELDLALRNFEGIVNVKEKNKLREQIPADVLEIIEQMRFTVDTFSKKLVELGIMDRSLEPVLDMDKGLGVYLTRTYRKYDDPEWVKNVPELVRAKAKTYLAANNVITEIDAAGNPVERALTEEELEGLVNYIASNTDPVMEGLNSASTGRVKLDILKGRKVIPQEIRDLMGEYKDPSVNFAKSIAKMATLIHTHQALKDIASENIGTIFFKEPQGDFFVPVAGKDATALQPLSGLYSTREIADAFKEVQATFEGDDWNMLALRTLAWINGAAKIGKTALSPASWVRNVIGGHILMLKDGHIGGKGYTEGWKKALGYFANKDQNDPTFQFKVREYIANGIMGEGVSAGEFQAIVKAAYASENPLEYLKKDTALGRFVTGVKGFYSAQDDIFRIWAYENEKARLIKRKPNMSEPELQAEASRKARATYPTYSELPEVVRKLAKFIPISSFPAFSAELIRTTKNSVQIAIEEMKDPDMRDVGVKRMAGVITALSFGSIISAASAMFVDVDDEEEKSLRRFLPEWSRNSQLVWLGRDENGMPRYIDLGFSDPFSYFKKPFVAFTSDKDNISDRAKDAVKEATAPFVSPEIFLSALVKGNKIVNESDDMDEVIGKYAGPIYEALEPGAIASGRRILKGVTGEVDRYGQQYSAGLETMAFFTGQRIKKFDVSVGFGFKAKEFNKRRTESLDAYYMEKSKTVKDEAAMGEELTAAEEKFQDYYSEFKKDYDAAMYLMTKNMTAKEAAKILDATMKDRNIPEMFRKSIKQNKPYPGIMKKD